MRIAVIPKTMSLDQAEKECMRFGAKNIRRANRLKQLYCEVEPLVALHLAQKVPGIVVKGVRKSVKADKLIMIPRTVTPMAEAVPISGMFWSLRQIMTPVLTGTGLTVAVLDTGMRKTHEALVGKVVYEANMTDAETLDDIFGHGTGVAYLIAGGIHAEGAKAGVAPGALLMNIKVIGDDGEGTEEDVVLGVEEVCAKVEDAQAASLWITDPLYPNAINMSIGAEDDGDVDNPIRTACRVANALFGLGVAAAAGNAGPGPTTITLPAADPVVVAVGAIDQPVLGQGQPFGIWEQSSRGPTEEGITKPDVVFWGVNIEVAGNGADDEYKVKTGTSFACPALVGASGLVWEGARRILGEDYYIGWEHIKTFINQLCGKPIDTPLDKDNTYGWGLPLPEVLLSLMRGYEAPVTAQVTQIAGLALMIGLVGSMMR